MGEGKRQLDVPLLRNEGAVLEVIHRARAQEWSALGLIGVPASDSYVDRLKEYGFPPKTLFRVSGTLGRNLIRELCSLNTLESLSMSYVGIGDEDARAIASSLESLALLGLRNNEIGAEGARAIATSLKSLTTLDLGRNEVGDEGAAAVGGALKSLTALDLGHNGIRSEGAKAIASLTSLVSLDLGRNDVGDEGAKAIAASLRLLVSLDLGHGRVGDEGAKAIAASLKSLKSLDLGHNEVGHEGAKTIAKSLMGLKRLDLGHNVVGAEGAKAIAESLTSLTSLDIASNGVGAAGAKVIAESLTSLTSLDIASNRTGAEGARAIAESLTSLTSLDLEGNGVGVEGARAIAGKLTALVSLSLRHNQVGNEGAKVIATSLPTLTRLDLGWNRIGIEGAQAIAEAARSLTTLDLGHNQVGAEGAKAIAGSLRSLRTLHLGHNRVEARGAKAIATSLTSLTSLDLAGNVIGDEGARAIAESLTALTSLVLGWNGIGADGAKAIAGSLTSLTTLDLGNNGVGAEGAKAIAASLTFLTTLDLGNNGVGAEGAKAIAGSLKSLTSLALTGNDVGAEGAKAIAASLRSLKSLYLARNGVGDEGASAIAGSLRTLTKLDLGNNGIRVEGAKAIAGRLPSLTSLNLAGNPLPKSLDRLVLGGMDAIRAYFLGLEEQGTARLFEAKVLFVGEPAAGKTSLMNKVVDPTYELRPSNPSTLGIDIESKWSFPWRQDASNQVRAHLWDFGGQNIQYYIHQFFLTERSLYVLVHNARKDAEHIDYWFSIIELLGTSRRHGTAEMQRCPVLVVGNEKHIDGVTTPLDQTKYRNLYPGLALEFFDVDLSRYGDGRLEAIRNRIEARVSELPHLGEPFPAGWVTVRQQVEERRAERHITFSEFQALCVSANVTREADQRVLAKLLHDLGVVLWYQDDPSLREFVFLDPVWVTQAMYTVLADKDLGSRFSERALFTRWGQQYTAHEKTLLLQLMQKHEFDLCYQLEVQQTRPGTANAANEREFLVPQLLGDVAPEEANRWQLGGCLRFQYRYAFMPMGIVTRLGVRLSDCIAQSGDLDLIWKSGFILERNEAQARVVQGRDRQGRQLIDVSITGPRLAAQQLLGLIRTEVERVHRRSFRDVNVEQLVPCCCVNCERADEPTLFALGDLEVRLKHRDTIDCTRPEGVESPSIRQLLEGVVQGAGARYTGHRELRAFLWEASSGASPYATEEIDRIQALLEKTRQPVIVHNTVNTEPKTPDTWRERWVAYATIGGLVFAVLAFFGVQSVRDLPGGAPRPQTAPPTAPSRPTVPDGVPSSRALESDAGAGELR